VGTSFVTAGAGPSSSSSSSDRRAQWQQWDAARYTLRLQCCSWCSSKRSVPDARVCNTTSTLTVLGAPGTALHAGCCPWCSCTTAAVGSCACLELGHGLQALPTGQCMLLLTTAGHANQCMTPVTNSLPGASWQLPGHIVPTFAPPPSPNPLAQHPSYPHPTHPTHPPTHAALPQH
jgi:hypothetical protein